MFRLHRDRIEQSVLSVRDQVSDKAFEIVEEICVADSFKFGRSQSYGPISKVIENGLTKILNIRVANVLPEQSFTDKELLNVVARRGSTGDVEVDGAIIEEYDEWNVIIHRSILYRIDERIEHPLPSDPAEIIARFKDERFHLHDLWADNYECVIRLREMPGYIADDDLPGQLKWLSSQERLYRKVGDDFRQGVFQRLRDDIQEELNDQINYKRQCEELGYSERNELAFTSLPPLLRILTSKDVTHAQIALLIEELIPGFSEETFSNQTIKSKFLAALSGKKSQTFRQKWSDHYGTTRKKSKVYQNTDKGLIENWVNEIDEHIKNTDKQINNKKLL